MKCRFVSGLPWKILSAPAVTRRLSLANDSVSGSVVGGVGGRVIGRWRDVAG